MKTVNEKEQIVYELLKRKFPYFKIYPNCRLMIPFTYQRNKRCDKNKADAPILKGKFIQVDFLMRNGRKKIAIEVDNTGHCSPTAKAVDMAKDKALLKCGFRVIRILYDIGFKAGVKKLLQKGGI